MILMLADGESYSTIEATVPCYRDYIDFSSLAPTAPPALRCSAAPTPQF
jgi:hypothetical protein